MLKKVLKAVAVLQVRATKNANAGLVDGTPMSKKLRKAILDLEGRAKEHDFAAGMAREAALHLRDLLKVGAPTAKSATTKPPTTVNQPATKAKVVAVKKAAAKPNAKTMGKPALKPPTTVNPPTTKAKVVAVKKAAAKPKAKTRGKPTLAAAIAHVLETRRHESAGGVKASQLYAEVQQAGYQFGGSNVENRMNYLHKTLRQHKTRFKRAVDGTIALA